VGRNYYCVFSYGPPQYLGHFMLRDGPDETGAPNCFMQNRRDSDNAGQWGAYPGLHNGQLLTLDEANTTVRIEYTDTGHWILCD